MHHLRLVLFLLAIAGPAAAQGVTLSGRLALGATSAGDHGAIAPADLTLSLPLGPAWEAELGTFVYILTDKRPHETYVALRRGGFRFGIPRPAYDAVLGSVFLEGAPWLAYREAETTRAYTTTRAMRVNAVPLGLSYEQQRGALWWGLSLHDDLRGNFQSASAALRWKSGPWQIAAAAEAVRRSGRGTEWNTKLGARWQRGRIDAGLTLFHPEASRNPDTLAGDLNLAISPTFALTAMVEATDAHDRDAAGLALHWRVAPDLTLSAAATHRKAATDLHLGLARRF